jgi:DNA primase
MSVEEERAQLQGPQPVQQREDALVLRRTPKGVYYCFFRTRAVTHPLHHGGGEPQLLRSGGALAQRFNINLEYEEGGGPSREDRTLRRELLDIHEQATAWFHEQFMAAEPLAAEVRDYWTGKRRFSLDVARDFKIGFAPPREETLMRLLTKKGHSVDALRQCGLYFAREGDNDPRRFLPRFRGRLMIPIREPTQGQVIAFTARVLPCTPEDDKTRDAKYVNSPETPLFKKSRMVFNLDRAKRARAGRPRLPDGRGPARRDPLLHERHHQHHRPTGHIRHR